MDNSVEFSEVKMFHIIDSDATLWHGEFTEPKPIRQIVRKGTQNWKVGTLLEKKSVLIYIDLSEGLP